MSDGLASGLVVGPAEEDGSKRVGFLEVADNGSKGGGVPAFCRSVGGAREDGEVGLDGGVLGFRERGWWGEFRFCCREAEVFQQSEVLVGDVNITVGRGATNRVIGEEEIADGA